MAVTEHAGRVLDWEPRFDPRSLNYRVAAVAGTSLPTAGRLWRTGRVLDQGAEGACVGFACAAEAAATPVPVPGADTDEYALAWFRRAQDLDEWPGRSYVGTSVLAGCLVGRERGVWSGFRWAKTAEEFLAGIASPLGGPGIAGINWREDSYDTDPLGVIRATGRSVGGHALLIPGFVPAKPSQYMTRKLASLDLLRGFMSAGEPCAIGLNSWGESYGKRGLFLIPLTVMRKWVEERAELAIPEGRKLPTTGGAK
jgi:hypothetical protein